VLAGDEQMFGAEEQILGWGPHRSNEDKMDLEYALIDCATSLIYGPYETFLQARERAEDFARWEIINRVGNLVDWSPTPSTVLTATQHAA